MPNLTITGQLRATRELGGTPGIVLGPVQVQAGNLVFEWTGAGDLPVRIEQTANFADWVTVAELEPGVTTWSAEPGAGAGFYRVVQ